MKLTKLWASALALLALASCSQDAHVVQPQEEPATRQVYIDLTAGQDPNDLRVAFGLDPLTGKTTGLQMSDKNVILRVSVRRASGEFHVQDLEFTKVPGQNKATYSGQITIPNGGTGDYTISAVLMKEAGTGGKVYASANDAAGISPQVSFSTLGVISHSAELIEANMPYVTEWQPLKIASSGVAERVVLELRPFGTLLRIRIQNEVDAERTFQAIRFTTNAFNTNLNFDLSLVRDSYPSWSSSNIEYYDLTLPSGVTVPGKVGDVASHSNWIYTVVYPRKTWSDVTTIASVRALGGNLMKTFQTNAYLPHGSVPLTLVYSESNEANLQDLTEHDGWGQSTKPKLAIEYVAQYNFDKTKLALVDNHMTDNQEVGFFFVDELTALTNPVMIGGVKYSLPTRGEMLSVFPARFDEINGSLIYNGNIRYTNYFERGVTIGGVTRNYYSDYSKASNSSTNPLYGLRFKNTTNCTAYRYRSETVDGTTSKVLIVDCIYVGLAAYELKDIEKPQFWTDNADKIVSRTFPLYGEKAALDATATGLNELSYYWTSSSFDITSSYKAAVNGGALGTVLLKGNSYLPARPWIRD